MSILRRRDSQGGDHAEHKDEMKLVKKRLSNVESRVALLEKQKQVYRRETT